MSNTACIQRISEMQPNSISAPDLREEPTTRTSNATSWSTITQYSRLLREHYIGIREQREINCIATTTEERSYFFAFGFGLAIIFCCTIVLSVCSLIVANGSVAKAGFERIAGILSASSVLHVRRRQ